MRPRGQPPSSRRPSAGATGAQLPTLYSLELAPKYIIPMGLSRTRKKTRAPCAARIPHLAMQPGFRLVHSICPFRAHRISTMRVVLHRLFCTQRLRTIIRESKAPSTFSNHHRKLKSQRNISTTPALSFAISFWNPSLYDIGSAPNARRHAQGSRRTVGSACTAFHTPVAVSYANSLALQLEHTMRTYLETHTAPDAGRLIQTQRHNITQIPKIIHCTILNPQVSNQPTKQQRQQQPQSEVVWPAASRIPPPKGRCTESNP